MIRQDSLSHVLVITAVVITIYLATFETTTIVLFPAVLLITGLTMELYLERKREYTDHIFEPTNLQTLGYYTALALVGFFISGTLISYLEIISNSITEFSTIRFIISRVKSWPSLNITFYQ